MYVVKRKYIGFWCRRHSIADGQSIRSQKSVRLISFNDEIGANSCQSSEHLVFQTICVKGIVVTTKLEFGNRFRIENNRTAGSVYARIPTCFSFRFYFIC